jgi:transcriptional regulator with XRE-family HTH domain
MPEQAFGRRLARLRGTRSQQAIARDFGVSRVTWNRWERGWQMPGPFVLRALAGYLRTELDWLAGRRVRRG